MLISRSFALLFITGFLASVAAQQTIAPLCDDSAQQLLNNCSKELIAMGFFDKNTDQTVMSTSDWHQYYDKLKSACRAYNRFNRCVGGSYVKLACIYSQDTIKTRYAATDKDLEFNCNYDLGIAEGEEYLAVLRSDNVTNCVKLIAKTENDSCAFIHDYLNCIKNPIINARKYYSGNELWNHMEKYYEKQVQLDMPSCSLASFVQLPSHIILGVLLITTLLVKKT